MSGQRDAASSGTPEDWQKLRELVVLYCRGIDRRDTAILRSIFHPDAQLDYGAGMFLGGVERFLAGLEQGMQNFSMTQHHVTNSVFRFSGETAVGETYLIAYHVLRAPENGMFIAGARYLDRFERREGSWRIIHRVAVQDWQSPDGQVSGVNRGALDRQDPSYRLLGEIG